MKRSLLKQTTAILLCLMMLLAVCACTPNNEVSNNASGDLSSDSDNSAEESSNEKKVYTAVIPEDFEWDSDEFIILSTWNDPSALIYSEFGYSNEDMESTVINDAVATRNNIVEDKLGIRIVEEMYTSPDRFNTGQFVTHVQQAASSGTGDFSLIAPSLYHAGALAKLGELYNLNNIKNMALESEWWDEYFVKDVNVMGKLYFITGDVGFFSKNTLSAVFFNKEIVASLELGDPYQLVKDKKWTVDVVHSWAKLYTNDLDGDGTIGHLDIFGMGGQNDNIKTFFYGAGEQFAKLGDEGKPVITVYSDRSANVIDKIQELITDTSCFVNANNLFNLSNTPVDFLVDAFVEGRSLLFCDSLMNIEGMRSMGVDFGILPIPLYEENQDRYRSLLNPWGGNAFAIAGNVDPSELEDIAVIFNVLGAEGKNLLTPAYIETTLKGQRLRDDDSEEMLDIIFDNIGCDIGFVYCFGRDAADLLAEVAKGQSFTTLIRSKESKYYADIENLINTFEGFAD